MSKKKKKMQTAKRFYDLSIPTAVYGREIYLTDTHLTSDPEVKRR